MADHSDMDNFESITSGEPIAPEVQQTPAVTQPRDVPTGQFASKSAPAAEVAEPTAEATQEEHPATGGIPQARLRAEAEKRREAEADASALRREIAELRGMVQGRQPAQAPQEPKAPATLWDDPDSFIGSQLTPIQQQVQEMREELWESRAASVHTPEVVTAAKAAAEKLFGTPEGKQLHQQLTSAGGNPFDNLVKWHKQTEALAKIGGDPDAWLTAERERLMNDPEFLAQAQERARGITPSTPTRSAPLTNLPPSLSRLPAGGNAPPSNDTSDGALFASSTARRR